jgi:hypothetical protein
LSADACAYSKDFDELKAAVAIAATDDVPPDVLKVTYGITMEKKGGGRPAYEAEMIALHYR